jgi:CDP-diacylglycerol--serine O-phosphatidyltransferase
MNTPAKKPFAMIREFHLADWFTLANAACGTCAIFAVMRYLVSADDVVYLYLACALVVAALVFDVLDGRVARWRQQSSPIGRELDSLADVISFGVAPAAIAYGCGMRGLYDLIILTYFVVCGVSRLARYNITAESLSGGSAKVTHFEGTPIPTSVVLVLMLASATALGATGADLWGGKLALAGFTLHPIALLFVLSGSLMISRLRIPKL